VIFDHWSEALSAPDLQPGVARLFRDACWQQFKGGSCCGFDVSLQVKL
jgi:hypothetical protein